MKIFVDKESRTPFYWQISAQIKEQILNGLLADGTILPSERILAEKTDVHRNTVIKAYAMLKDEDLIESVHGVGYRVTCKTEESLSETAKGEVNWSNVIKDEYLDMERTFDEIYLRFTEGNRISFSTGMPPSVYDEERLAMDLAEILREKRQQPGYLSPYQGDTDLRKSIVSFLRTKGIRAGLGDIQVLTETNQALDFIVTAMLNTGDCVIVEEPVSPDVYRVIRLAGCRAVAVPVDEDGMLCEKLEALVQKHKPKFIYVNSSFHDPTGSVLSIERRKLLLDISNRYRVPIVEEDAASELAFDQQNMPVPIKSMDKKNNVIYIYSFSLTFIPGLSLAFVAAPEKLIKSLSYLVSIRIISLDLITQKLLAKYLNDGSYDRHVERIREEIQKKKKLMCSCLRRLEPYGIRFKEPKGGVYIWCKLPGNIDSREVVKRCSREGVSMIPGDVFYPERNFGQNHIRLNYSFETESRIIEGMETFQRVILELAKNV